MYTDEYRCIQMPHYGYDLMLILPFSQTTLCIIYLASLTTAMIFVYKFNKAL